VPASKEEPVIINENISIQELDEEDLKQMKLNEDEEKRQIKLIEQEEKRQIKLIQEDEEKEFKKSLIKTQKENIKKPNVKKQKEKIEPVDDSYNPDADLKIIREDSDLDKPEMKKVSDIEVEKIKEKLKK
jgi:hypothetical protein